MTITGYGPVDLYLLGLPDGQPDRAALQALLDLVETETLRLLDLIHISRSADGAITLTEVDDLSPAYGVQAHQLHASGLAGQEDIATLAVAVPAGTAALLVAVELVYQRELSARTAESGAVLLGHERIPAPVVNALMDSLPSRTEG
ncbi:DUF6325 family protein [Microbacterium saperdae]|uniref:DUF1269 domain-containing protein n=1 Tax=Microbacterium saperdae TaxID=69368 RepID=A0A543BMC5_9MICO|nr:DUF6325 family protein [Microbacterium saperdae]TQL85989.1 hypothetical protein FB560_1627 [Microbacterium saperdae]GGM51473.1 hypothetical protein GCM10010489_23740 [Microbacterium saperdae]